MKTFSTLLISLLLLLSIAAFNSCGEAKARRAKVKGTPLPVSTIISHEYEDDLHIEVRRTETRYKLLTYDSTITDMVTGKVRFKMSKTTK